MRTDEIGNRQGKLLPRLNEPLIFGIEWVMVRNRAAPVKLVLVVKRLRLKTPILFEVE